MRIDSEIKSYRLAQSANLLEALQAIDINKSGIVFIVDDFGRLVGSLTDGDIRRYLLKTDVDIKNSLVLQAMNRDVVVVNHEEQATFKYDRYFPKVKIFPLVDSHHRLIKVVHSGCPDISIDGRGVSLQNPLIIAEIGNNHNGIFSDAVRLIDSAIEAGADCVKFQLRNMADLYGTAGHSDSSNHDLGVEYTLDILRSFNLDKVVIADLMRYVRSKGAIPLCTPWDLASLDFLVDFGVGAIKIASADLTNSDLLSAAASSGVPVILSTGMSSEIEIVQAVDILKKYHAQAVLLHCNSTYPAPLHHINLKYMSRLKEISGFPVGYSGHERGYEIPIAAIALGAVVIEKHITLDRNALGPDHKASLLPEEFSQMTRMIRNVVSALGNDDSRQVTQGELLNRDSLAKSLFASRDIEEGEYISESDILIRSPGIGLQPNQRVRLIGRRANRRVAVGTCFTPTDIGEGVEPRTSYNFSRPYGIPVRFHDFDQLYANSQMSLVEFHLSYKDVDTVDSFKLEQTRKLNLVVHAPELFSEDHIIDLASENESYRDKSVNEIARTLEATRKIAKYFDTPKPLLILNAGGWSRVGFCNPKLRMEMYARVSSALKSLSCTDIDILVQTMPPMPWHLGGQSYHNLFVLPDEIARFSIDTGFKICLDVSHSVMATNFHKIDFDIFLEKVLPHVAHLHVSDAKGIDGEGVQMGKGDVNFAKLSRFAKQLAPNVGFIPEVWQGHKDGGSGFWSALEFLESINF